MSSNCGRRLDSRHALNHHSSRLIEPQRMELFQSLLCILYIAKSKPSIFLPSVSTCIEALLLAKHILRAKVISS